MVKLVAGYGFLRLQFDVVPTGVSTWEWCNG